MCVRLYKSGILQQATLIFILLYFCSNLLAALLPQLPLYRNLTVNVFHAISFFTVK